jgi:CheY-like chemotaxis protein
VTGRKVLVVDDDDEIREITQLALEVMGGWQVLSADRGAKALKVAREHRPDVVLLDVMMPDMDGPTTFSRMQLDPATRDIPVILLTAKVQVGHVQVWDSMPVVGVISKPFNPATLSDEVDALLREHEARPQWHHRWGSAHGQSSA